MKSLQIMDATYLDEREKKCYSDLQVMQSAAGWYIGTTYRNPGGLMEPGSRDTDYFPNKETAEKVLWILETLYAFGKSREPELLPEDHVMNCFEQILAMLGLDPRGVGYRLTP